MYICRYLITVGENWRCVFVFIIFRIRAEKKLFWSFSRANTYVGYHIKNLKFHQRFMQELNIRTQYSYVWCIILPSTVQHIGLQCRRLQLIASNIKFTRAQSIFTGLNLHTNNTPHCNCPFPRVPSKVSKITSSDWGTSEKYARQKVG